MNRPPEPEPDLTPWADAVHFKLGSQRDWPGLGRPVHFSWGISGYWQVRISVDGDVRWPGHGADHCGVFTHRETGSFAIGTHKSLAKAVESAMFAAALWESTL